MTIRKISQFDLFTKRLERQSGCEHESKWIERVRIERIGAEAIVNLRSLFLSTDKSKRASPVVQELAFQMLTMRGREERLLENKLLMRITEKNMQKNLQAADLIKDAQELLILWDKGPMRAGIERAFMLKAIWIELGHPIGISRDELWKLFEERHPELLDDVQNERKAKSLAFKEDELSFLKSNPGGKPK